jgi:predicted transcriptional regulator
MKQRVTLEKLSEIIPLLENNKLDIDQLTIVLGRSRPTINRWLRRLRDAGYEPRLTYKMGRPKLKI